MPWTYITGVETPTSGALGPGHLLSRRVCYGLADHGQTLSFAAGYSSKGKEKRVLIDLLKCLLTLTGGPLVNSPFLASQRVLFRDSDLAPRQRASPGRLSDSF